MKENRGPLTRRAFLFSLSSTFGLLTSAKSARSFCRALCEGECGNMPSPIALIASLTGWGAGTGSQLVSGAKLAIRQINQAGGSKLHLNIFDDEGSPRRAFEVGMRAAGKGNRVVIGALSAPFTRKLAENFTKVLFFDLIQAEAIDGTRPRNAFWIQSIPQIKTKKEGCPNGEFEWQTYTVIQILSSAVRWAHTSDVDILIRNLGSRTLQTAAGNVKLSSSGIYHFQ